MTTVETDRTVERLHRQQAALAKFGSFAFKEIDLPTILAEAARICAASLAVPFCKICRYRAAENDLLIEAGCGWDAGVVGQVVSRCDETSPQGRAYVTREPVIIRDVRDGNNLILPDFYRAHHIISTVDVIISATDGTPYGILEVDSPTLHQYDEHDINFLTGFANVLAEAVARIQKNEATRQSQKMETIGRLTGGVAHDFNNVLAIVISYLDLLQSLPPSGDEVSELVAGALAASLRGVALTEQLLAFARLQPLYPSRLALNEHVTETFRLLARTLGERVSIVLNLEPNLWPVIADPTQLQACIINLASNARDAMPNGGTLTITTANSHLDAGYAALHAEVTPGDYAMIEVSDTGVGIQPGVVGQIFEPFFTTKELAHGTGLGLSMAFGFFKQSKGDISVSSKLGIGTTFRLYLPRTAEDAQPIIPVPRPALQDGNGELVLVVEDEPRLRHIAVQLLRNLGYRVTEADCASTALELLTKQPVQIVFSDITMPGEMDGVGLANQILQRWPTIKIILTSGFPETRILGALADDPDGRVLMLNKPYRRVDLAHAAWQVLHP